MVLIAALVVMLILSPLLLSSLALTFSSRDRAVLVRCCYCCCFCCWPFFAPAVVYHRRRWGHFQFLHHDHLLTSSYVYPAPPTHAPLSAAGLFLPSVAVVSFPATVAMAVCHHTHPFPLPHPCPDNLPQRRECWLQLRERCLHFHLCLPHPLLFCSPFAMQLQRGRCGARSRCCPALCGRIRDLLVVLWLNVFLWGLRPVEHHRKWHPYRHMRWHVAEHRRVNHRGDRTVVEIVHDSGLLSFWFFCCCCSSCLFCLRPFFVCVFSTRGSWPYRTCITDRPSRCSVIPSGRADTKTPSNAQQWLSTIRQRAKVRRHEHVRHSTQPRRHSSGWTRGGGRGGRALLVWHERDYLDLAHHVAQVCGGACDGKRKLHCQWLKSDKPPDSISRHVLEIVQSCSPIFECPWLAYVNDVKGFAYCILDEI